MGQLFEFVASTVLLIVTHLLTERLNLCISVLSVFWVFLVIFLNLKYSLPNCSWGQVLWNPQE